MIEEIKMGLKPFGHLHSANPFTEVNSLPRIVGGNLKINFFIESFLWRFLLPSALADGFYKLLQNLALATFGNAKIERLIRVN